MLSAFRVSIFKRLAAGWSATLKATESRVAPVGALPSPAAAATTPLPGPPALPPHRPMASSAPASGTPGAADEALFHQQAALYAQYRPDYPPQLLDTILEFASLPRRTLALDVGTGSGQVAAALSDRFDHVLASDATQQQLDHAVRRANITYFRAAAERLEGFVADGSVDLLTAAQGLHWFDAPAFYAEARRVLQPGGTLAVWGYGLPFFCNPPGRAHPPATLATLRRALQEMHTTTLGAHWDSRRWLVDNSYRGLEPGAGEFASVQRRDDLRMHKDVSVAAVLGYVASWSSYVAYRRQHPQAPDPLTPFREQLLAALGVEEEEANAAAAPMLRLEWPLFLTLAKGPLPAAAR